MFLRWLALWFLGLALAQAGAGTELIRDPHFRSGFYLLKPEPGQRVVYGELPGLNGGAPVWDLAQWSSRFPLQPTEGFESGQNLIWSNSAKAVVVGYLGGADGDLSLAVNAGAEYPRARASIREPWVHLLVQQDLTNRPSLGALTALEFHLEARLTRSRLVTTNDYSPALHAAQFLVYLTVGNRNPKSPGYGDCIWFGIPVYDNRHREIPSYEARDFGDTKLFIFTPGSSTFTRESTQDGHWVTFKRDLLPLVREGLEHARAKGFIRDSSRFGDFRPLGVFIGWEVPGMFDVALNLRDLSVKAMFR